MSPRVIRLSILQMLDAAAAGGLPESMLLKGLNAELEPPMAAEAFSAHLRWLIDHRMVDQICEALDDDGRRWVITRFGKGAIKQ